jgi:glycosyltransferase involved in cell wall biosynthesis
MPHENSFEPIRLVSLAVVAYNEEETLGGLLRDITSQDYPHERVEVVLVDGASTDYTRMIMERFAAEERSFTAVKVVDNPKRIQPCGWNVAIAESTGDVIIRVDAHASIPSDFVRRTVDVLGSGEHVCGGYRPTVLAEATPWRETLLLAEHVALGGNLALNRRKAQAGYVSTVFHGAYRKEVFDRAGMFDERLVRTEDNEIHYRIRKAGYRIRYDPHIRSKQFIRSSLGALLRQKYSNGFWVGLTLYVCPGCISPYHLVPLAFVALVVLGLPLGALWSWLPLVVLGGLYVLVNLGISLLAIGGSEQRNVTMALLPVVVLAIHLCYGWGTLIGIIRGLFWDKAKQL